MTMTRAAVARGLLRLGIVYVVGFAVLWLVRWAPFHVDLEQHCRTPVAIPFDERIYRGEYDLTLCQEFDPARGESLCEAIRRKPLAPPTKYRAASSQEIGACIRSGVFDQITRQTLSWFIGVPLAIAAAIIGYWLLKKVLWLALVIAAWVAAGFADRPKRS